MAFRSFGLLCVVPFVAACSVDADGELSSSANAGADGSTAGDGSSLNSDGGTVSPGDSSVSENDSSFPADGTAPTGPLFAFVGSSDGKIRVYTVDPASGAWTFKKDANAGTNPSFLAIDAPRRRVFALDESQSLVRAFSFDPDTATLTEKNTRPSGGNGPAHLSIDPTGGWLFVANYGGGNMSVFPIDGAGAIGAASDTKPSGVKSHWAGTNPSGTFVFVPALGANAVAQYSLNTTNGKLGDNGAGSLPAGAGPRHIAFHPSEKWAYVINETAISVTAFDFDKGTGKLTQKGTVSALPPGQSAAGVSGAEIFVHPNGKYVYASTRVFNSIVQFSIASDGALTRVANVTTGANRPRNFGIDPSGSFLFAGNQDAAHVVGFGIDSSSGALTSIGKSTDVAGPAFVGLSYVP